MLAAIGFAASRPRARLMSAAVLAQASALRDEMITVAPCSASRSAMALPMPREEPVTIATRPSRSNRLLKLSLPMDGPSLTIASFAATAPEVGRSQLKIAASGRERDRLDLGVDARPFAKTERIPRLSREPRQQPRARPVRSKRQDGDDLIRVDRLHRDDAPGQNVEDRAWTGRFAREAHVAGDDPNAPPLAGRGGRRGRGERAAAHFQGDEAVSLVTRLDDAVQAHRRVAGERKRERRVALQILERA